jgi:glucose-1-phosphate adenylyltransferase
LKSNICLGGNDKMGGLSNKVVGMILAGGRGSRMGLLCQDRAKPALPFGGGGRVIDFVLNNFLNSQIDRVSALTDYQGARLADYVKHWEKAHASPDITILPPGSGSYVGTANAIFQNLDYIVASQAERILIAAGDHVYNMDYREMLEFHEAAGADVTVGVVQVPFESASRFGTLKVNPQGRITEFVEKSSLPVSDLASMGIYVFNRRALVERLAEDATDSNSPHDFGYAILPKMIKRDKVFAFRFKGYWRDIGTISSYYESNMELLNSTIGHTVFDDDGPVLEPIRGLLTSDIRGAIVNSMVSPGCIIQGLVQNSILSPGVFVSEKTIVRDSIILPGCHIGSNSVVDRCILDENVRVGKFSRLGLGAGQPPGSEITLFGSNLSIPAFTGLEEKPSQTVQPSASSAILPLIRPG